MEDRLLTVSEVAQILRTNVDYVYKLYRTGLLKFMPVEVQSENAGVLPGAL